MLTDFTKSERMAWQYIESAVNQGINATKALTAYRDNGGKINTQKWYADYNKIESSAKEWNTLRYLKPTDTLPESLFLDTPNKYQNKYVVKFTASIRDQFTGEPVTLSRQVGFDNRPTLQELESIAEDYLTEDKSQPASVVIYTTELKFYKRAG
jgi:hypothetical protein